MPGLFAVKRLLLVAIVGGAACVLASSAASTNDPVTSLPVYPGVTDPDPLPKASVCRKTMQEDFYMVMGQNVDVVVDWYARHLAGYKKYHAITDHRSQDTFFNSDGTKKSLSPVIRTIPKCSPSRMAVFSPASRSLRGHRLIPANKYASNSGETSGAAPKYPLAVKASGSPSTIRNSPNWKSGPTQDLKDSKAQEAHQSFRRVGRCQHK